MPGIKFSDNLCLAPLPQGYGRTLNGFELLADKTKHTITIMLIINRLISYLMRHGQNVFAGRHGLIFYFDFNGSRRA